MATPIWGIEGVALDSTGEEVADSLGVVTKANATAIATIDAETDKIDQAATDGLAGTSNSLAYRVHEIEKHHHGREFWWGSDGSPDETTAIAANVNAPFVAVSGNNTWGTAISIMGTNDVPANIGDVRYDARRILVTDTDHTTPYRMRLIWGSGTSAAAIIALQMSEFMFVTAGGPFSSGAPVNLQMPRGTVGEKLWAQVWNATNSSEVDFFYGVHGYAG